jgi:hypothetical protein
VIGVCGVLFITEQFKPIKLTTFFSEKYVFDLNLDCERIFDDRSGSHSELLIL